MPSKMDRHAVTASAMLNICAAKGEDGHAIVRDVRASAKYSTLSDRWRPLKVGRVLPPASTISTGVNSKADIFPGENGPIIRMLAENDLGVG